MEILKSLFKYFTMRMIEVKSQPQECTFKARPLNILPSERKFTKFYLDTHFIIDTAIKLREGEQSGTIISGKIKKF